MNINNKTFSDIFNNNVQQEGNCEWPIWVMFVVRDLDNIRNEFNVYKEVNDDRTKELVEKLITKYEENKEEMLKMKITFGFIISVMVFCTGVISAVFSDIVRDFILKILK